MIKQNLTFNSEPTSVLILQVFIRFLGIFNLKLKYFDSSGVPFWMTKNGNFALNHVGKMLHDGQSQNP